MSVEMSGRHCHYENYREIVSYLTGNTVTVNIDQNRFLLFPEDRWNHERLGLELATLSTKRSWTNAQSNARSPVFLAAVAPFFATPSHKAAVSALDAIMAGRENWGQPNRKGKEGRAASVRAAKPWYLNDKARIREFLLALWRGGVLVMPMSAPEFVRAHWATGAKVLDTVDRACLKLLGQQEQYAKQMLAQFEDILVRIRFSEAIGDFVPDALNLMSFSRQSRFSKLAIAIVAAQGDFHGHIRHRSIDYWPRHTYQRDTKFSWVEGKDRNLSAWVEIASEYIKESRNSVANRIQAMRYFFKYLIENKHIPRSPEDLLSLKTYDAHLFSETPISHYNLIVDFFEFAIASRFSEETHFGERRPRPGIRNPISKKGDPLKSLGESSRDAVPPHILKIMIETLIENDWSWPKGVCGLPGTGGKSGPDWFLWEDPTTGEREYVWAPARAIALFAKLRFPARTMQIRMLDSGEADDLIPDLDRMKMVENNSLLRAAALVGSLPLSRGRRRKNLGAPTQKGVVQIVEGRIRPFLTMKFTTNKTADINKESWNKGYTAPWMPDDLAKELIALRDWQTKYNPLPKPTEWTDLQEFKGRKHDVQLAGMRNCFLFRDRTIPDPARRGEPIGDAKVKWLWLALCEEVERRLRSAGIVGPDGEPIRLVASRNARGDACASIYDLHALRVSLITHYIEHGEVAPDVIMKIVGHATVVMTMYYVKHSQEHIAEVMMYADGKARDTAQRQWIEAARSREIGELQSLVHAASDAALRAFHGAPNGSIVPLIAGICPVGAGRCHQGGPSLNPKSSEDRPTPVPGGRANCAGCRYFISGEPWLEGVQTEFNVRSYEMTGLTRQRERLEERLHPLDDERQTAMREGRIFQGHREWEALTHQIQEIEARQNQLTLEMANLLMLEQQIRGIAKRRMAAQETGLALVVGDIVTVEAALEESTEWDLADRICRYAVAYPSLAARGNLTEAASNFRARRYDRVLMRHGLDVRFLDLDDELSAYVGNRMSEWLDMRVGRRNTIRLMEGEVMIKDICDQTGLLPEALRQELEAFLDQAIARRLATAAERRQIGAPDFSSVE